MLYHNTCGTDLVVPQRLRYRPGWYPRVPGTFFLWVSWFKVPSGTFRCSPATSRHGWHPEAEGQYDATQQAFSNALEERRCRRTKKNVFLEILAASQVLHRTLRVRLAELLDQATFSITLPISRHGRYSHQLPSLGTKLRPQLVAHVRICRPCEEQISRWFFITRVHAQ